MAKSWWKAEAGEVNGLVMSYVEAVESAQFDVYDRFVKLDALYDTALNGSTTGSQAFVSENVIASNVDTVYATIAAAEVRPRLVTDDGDWSMQRRASHLSFYAEGLSKLLKVDEACRRAFKSGALKGTGLVKVYVDEFDEIRVERTLPDDIVVDESEVRAGNPRQMHQRMIVDCESLKARFSESEDEIERAAKGRNSGGPRMWADYRPIERDEIVCIESWYLPVGVKDKKGYKPGRHTITMDGCDLFDEEWEKPFFPFAVFRWSERETGWFGIGLAERIVGHQRVINKSNWQADRLLDQNAAPTTYVGPADANIAIKSRGPLGTIAVTHSGKPPITVQPPAVSPETYKRIADAKASASEESGVSPMASRAMKPAGLDSGAALREHRDQTTQRHSQQEKGFEQLKLDAVWLALDCAKDLGAKAPVIVRKSRHGPNKFPWAKVDMGEVRVQLVAASNLSRTPAGRTQMVMEAAQAGIISQDAARRLMMPNSPLDFQREMSLYTAAVENIERCIEEILDGDIRVPEPFQNTKLIVWRGQMSLMKAEDDGAPEEVLENLRQWVTQAAYVVSQAEAPPPQDMAMSAAPMGPPDASAEAMPPMDPTMAGAVAGPPIGPDSFAGAGMSAANLLA